MTEMPILTPTPLHPITIERFAGEVIVRAGGTIIARSRRALELREATLPPVFYIPRDDAEMALLAASAHHSYCPYKGTASYFSIPAGGERSVDAIWTYDHPFPAVAAIAGHLAFYPSRVDTIAATPEATA